MSADRDRVMNRRSRGREIALQVLYQVEQNPELDQTEVERFISRRVREPWLRGLAIESVRRERPELSPAETAVLIERRLESHKGDPADRAVSDHDPTRIFQDLARAVDLREFVRGLYAGVRANQPLLDQSIAEVAENWRIDRMAAIDRNIIRLGAYEILFVPEVPRGVAINEALEIAKRYSTAQSSRFVNGILDRLRARVENEPVPQSPGAESPIPRETDGPVISG